MVSLVVLYNVADGVKEGDFERWYKEVHLGDVKKIPGIKRFSYCVARGAPEGEPPHSRLAMLTFDDMESMKRGLDSPEAKHVMDDGALRIKDMVAVFYEEKLSF